MYVTTDFFQVNNKSLNNYTFALFYFGHRWYGSMVMPDFTSRVLVGKETFHAFWSKSTQANPPLIISAPTTAGSPEGVDFYEMRRRSADMMASNGYNYGPFGVLIPLVEYEGSGFFHCGTL